MNENELSESKTKRSALLTVFLVVLIDLMGFGIVLPLLPFYASKFDASPLMIGFLYSVYSLAQLVSSPLWGSLSDRIGRRPIMLLSTFGAALAYILFAFSNSLGILLVSRLLAGIMGGNISTAQAYVADVTSTRDRAKGMGLIGAAFGIGFVAGPAIAAALLHPSFYHGLDALGFKVFSALAEKNKYTLPGLFAAGLSALSFLMVLSRLPETVKKNSSQQNQDTQRIFRCAIYKPSFWKALSEEKKRAPLLPLLFLCVFLLSLGQSSLYSAFPLFCSKKLGLTPEKVGMQFAIMGIVAVLIQGGMIRFLEKAFGEKRLFITGSFLMAFGFALIPFASSEKTLTAFLVLMAIGGSLNGPTLNSLISKNAQSQEVGKVMGSSQGISALGRVIGPVWGGAFFSISARLPFWATAFVVFGTFFIGLRFHE